MLYMLSINVILWIISLPSLIELIELINDFIFFIILHIFFLNYILYYYFYISETIKFILLTYFRDVNNCKNIIFDLCVSLSAVFQKNKLKKRILIY